MANLRDFERRLGDLVEGFFGKAFRSGLQPVELARRIVREMEGGKTVSVRSVWVPNRYAFAVSGEDREHFAQIEQALSHELEQVVVENARERGWGLLGPPEVAFETDEELRRGQFRCEASLVQSEDVQTGEHTAFLPAANLEGGQVVAAGPASLVLLDNGADIRTYALDKDRIRIGRMADCDVILQDSGASRHHAEVRREDGRFILADLGSTNGTLLNESSVREQELQAGDRITIGRTVLEFRTG